VGTTFLAVMSTTVAPPTWIRPDVGVSRPATQRSVVVFPQPLGPSRVTRLPSAMSRSTSWTATVDRNSFASPSTTIPPMFVPSPSCQVETPAQDPRRKIRVMTDTT
jgi:hypothetical protein